jgi:hypothetical protein
MYIHDTPIVGQDFFGPGTYVRTGENGVLYCGNCDENCHGGEGHTEGQVVMGAFWKMRQRLNQSLGDASGDLVADTLLLAWFQAFDQKFICDVMLSQLLAIDDDDGDIFNGTPHHLDINGGFHGSGLPGHQGQEGGHRSRGRGRGSGSRPGDDHRAGGLPVRRAGQAGVDLVLDRLRQQLRRGADGSHGEPETSGKARSRRCRR